MCQTPAATVSMEPEILVTSRMICPILVFLVVSSVIPFFKSFYKYNNILLRKKIFLVSSCL